MDGTEETGGIDASAAMFGAGFAHGMLTAQDGRNQTPDSGTAAGANQNHKLVLPGRILAP